jgi:hypothetical protein
MDDEQVVSLVILTFLDTNHEHWTSFSRSSVDD